jgi:hypothetical protein
MHLARRLSFLVVLAALACTPDAPVHQYALSPIDSPAGPGAAEPNLHTAPDGRVVLSWLEPVAGEGHALRLSVRGTDGAWSEPREVLRRNDLFVNWADFPSVTALADGRLVAHWLQRNGTARYAYEVRMSESRDGGASWSAPVTPHAAGVQAEHGFVSVLPTADGAQVYFLDGGNNLGAHAHAGDGHGTPMSLAMNTWSAAMRPQTKTVIDTRVCDCCQTSAAMTASGPVIVYRDRSDGTPEIRDIAISRLVDGKWTAGARVHADNWEVNYCPVNGPMVQAYGDTVAVAWFTGARDTAKVQVAFSYDAGASFGAPVRVDDGTPAGRVALQLFDGAAYVSWLERGTGDSASVRLRRVTRDGTLGASVVVSESSGARSAGFPRMTRIADGLLLAWTEPGSPSVIKSATYRRSE